MCWLRSSTSGGKARPSAGACSRCSSLRQFARVSRPRVETFTSPHSVRNKEIHHACLDPIVRRSLADRLQRLSSNFDSLGHQLRDEIATAVGKAIAEAVSDALRSVLGTSTDGHPAALSSELAPGTESAAVGTTRASASYDPWAEPTDDPWLLENRYEPEQDEDSDPEPTTSASSGKARMRSWLTALATGWRAGVWWLKRQRGKAPVLTTVAVGLAAGLVILAAGPLTAAGVSAVGRHRRPDLAGGHGPVHRRQPGRRLQPVITPCTPNSSWSIRPCPLTAQPQAQPWVVEPER